VCQIISPSISIFLHLHENKQTPQPTLHHSPSNYIIPATKPESCSRVTKPPNGHSSCRLFEDSRGSWYVSI
jgi:hypothetical protein